MRCKFCTRKNMLLIGVIGLIIVVSYILINVYYITTENKILNNIEKNRLKIENIVNSYYDSGKWDFSGVSKEEIKDNIELVEEQLELYLKYRKIVDKKSIIIREKNLLAKRKSFLEKYDSNYEEYGRLLRFLELELEHSIGIYDAHTLYYKAEESILDRIAGDDIVEKPYPEAEPVSIIKDGEEILI